MAHGLNRFALGVVAYALAAGCTDGVARAQSLSDPMKPPAIMIAGPVGGEPAAGVQAEMLLQSTLLSKGRRIAMIDGKPRRVGDRIGAARIVAIDPASVTLKEGSATRVLRLYRRVDISNAGAAHAPAPPGGGKEGNR